MKIKSLMCKTVISADNNDPKVRTIIYLYVLAQYAIIALSIMWGFGIYPTLMTFSGLMVASMVGWFIMTYIGIWAIMAIFAKAKINHKQFIKAYLSCGRIPVLTAFTL